MAKKALISVAAVLAILLVAILTRPADFRIERRASIAAPPELVFAQVNDFHQWLAWSPWDKLDPAMKRTYGGPASGDGATYAWLGNEKVGEGKMTITQATASSRVAITLEFIAPFRTTNQTEFTFTPRGPGTEVVWAMTGQRGFMEKAFSLVMDMDKMVGPDFERGLAAMKTAAEAEAAKRAAPPPEPPATPEGAAPAAPSGAADAGGL